MAAAEEVPVPVPVDRGALEDHWAFRPLADAAPPGGSEWSERPIDAFVFARLQSEGLQPAADADRRDLIRRLSFQIVGLPPTADETDAFLADEGPDAVGRVVDRLLASPRFGERWGRHWLDLARYADSNGLDENFLFREAWRYRNWVIGALNADMPFDRFALEQVAGDLLPYDSPGQRDSQRIAAGFLVVGPKVLLGVEEERQRLDVADEQIDTIGRAFLGLTLGCARCHDHKFEPVPTREYYALAGVLTSTQVMETRHMLNEQRLMERLVGLGDQGEDLDARYEEFWRGFPKLQARAEQAKSARDLLNGGDADGLAALAEKHPDALAEGAKDPAVPADERVVAQEALVAELEAAVANPPGIPPRAMVPCDVELPGDEAVRSAGQYDQPAEVVPRGFIQAASVGPPPEIPAGHSGRLELGRWLTDAEHGAGNLTARVLANRVWHHLVGQGIVRTVDNFGRSGEIPSHPELLDHLASDLIDSGWSIKSLVRQIALSRTFAMGSDPNARAEEADPDNRLLWRGHRRRLDPESLRDAILAAAGQLDLTPMDSSVWYLGDQATAVGANEIRRRTDFPCRSVYLPVIRNDLPELFAAFDFADAHTTTGARSETMVPTQGLFLLNDEMILAAADALAGRLAEDVPEGGADARIDRMFELALANPPSEDERIALRDFVAEAERRLADEGDAEPGQRAWSMACHALFSMSRFQFLE
ncbi:PSD1 and planctomycete cytochrome C domain-containing protein [soil metagenome]